MRRAKAKIHSITASHSGNTIKSVNIVVRHYPWPYQSYCYTAVGMFFACAERIEIYLGCHPTNRDSVLLYRTTECTTYEFAGFRAKWRWVFMRRNCQVGLVRYINTKLLAHDSAHAHGTRAVRDWLTAS